ncbi:MAG: hypothetical protein GT600_15895 [Bacteroidales bacterium]|jgi:hypothetical protein|nr:hypothetical protein [Bacteroidales bacterium]
MLAETGIPETETLPVIQLTENEYPATKALSGLRKGLIITQVKRNVR